MRVGNLTHAPAASRRPATSNRRVEGGGDLGGVLHDRFAEAFRPLAPWIEARAGVAFDPRMLSLPGRLPLTIVALRGADLGVRALWVVVAVLAASLSRATSRRPSAA